MILDAVCLLASVFLEGWSLCRLLTVVLQALGRMERLLSMGCEVLLFVCSSMDPFCLHMGLLIQA